MLIFVIISAMVFYIGYFLTQRQLAAEVVIDRVEEEHQLQEAYDADDEEEEGYFTD